MRRRAGSLPLFVAMLLPIGLLLGGCTETGTLAALQAPAAMPAQDGRGDAYVALGKRLLAAEEPELAYKAFMTSIRIDGVSAAALNGAGIASAKQGLLTAARRHFQQALTVDPESLTAHNNLGVVLFRLKEYYPARDAFRAAFALSSGRDGIAERNLNRAEAVVAQIEEAEQSDPAVSYRVVRLGTSEFRITPKVDASAELRPAD